MIETRVAQTTYHTLDARQSHDVFMQVLVQLCGQHYIQDGQLWRMDGSHTGIRFDVCERVPKHDYPESQYERLVMLCKMRKKFERLCYTFEEHRYHKGKCVECGREEEK
jgi:hypothetical protein